MSLDYPEWKLTFLSEEKDEVLLAGFSLSCPTLANCEGVLSGLSLPDLWTWNIRRSDFDFWRSLENHLARGGLRALAPGDRGPALPQGRFFALA